MTADTPRGGPEFAKFLLARIAEDEAAARKGISSQADPENGWAYEGRALIPHVGIIHEAVQAAHIIRWRVLAECEAKRRIVAEHAETCARCSGGNPDDYAIDGDWPEAPCDTLRAFAAVYRDHPDYRPEWRL